MIEAESEQTLAVPEDEFTDFLQQADALADIAQREGLAHEPRCQGCNNLRWLGEQTRRMSYNLTMQIAELNEITLNS